MLCLEVVNICADEERLDEAAQGRYGPDGYLYNVHYPADPEKFAGKSRDWLAVLQKYRGMKEY